MPASTFGRTTISGNTNFSSFTSTQNQQASSAVAPEDGTVVAISGYAAGHNAQLANAQFGIWDNSGTLLGNTGQFTLPSGSFSLNGQSWNNDIALTAPVAISNAATYWIGFFKPTSSTIDWSWINTGTTEYSSTPPSSIGNMGTVTTLTSHTNSFSADYVSATTKNNYLGPHLIDGQFNAGTSGSATVTPSGVMVGDLLLAFHHFAPGRVSNTLPSGWHQLDKITNTLSNFVTVVAWKVATASDIGAAQQFSSGSPTNSLVLMTWRGAFTRTNNASDIFDGESGEQNTGGTNWTCPSISPLVANSVIVVGGQSSGQVSTMKTWPKNDFIPIQNGSSVYCAYQLNTATGSTGTLVGTFDVGDPSTAIALAIKAAPTTEPISDAATGGAGTGGAAFSDFTTLAPTDSGTGTDSAAAAVTPAIPTDTATGTDTLSSIGITVPAPVPTDAATGTDTPSLATITPAVADAGSGTDTAATFAAPAIPADSASGTETQGSSATVPLTDSASGTEAPSFVAPITAPVLDPGVQGENAGENVVGGTVVFATSPETDTAAGQPEILFMGVVRAPQADAGTGADTPTLALISVGLSDPASGAETPTLSVLSVSLATDTGAGVDAPTVYQLLPLADTATGNVLTGLPAPLPAPPPLSGMSDARLATFVTLATTGAAPDVGTGADVPTLAIIAVPLTDAASGADGVAVKVSMPIPTPPPDAATGTDTLTLTLPIVVSVADYGTGQELLSASVTLSVPVDAGTGLDVVTTTGLITVVDAATGLEGVALAIATITLADAGVQADNAAILVSFPIPDSGAGQDIPYLGQVGIAVAENASGTDIPSVVLRAPNLPEPGAGADVPSLATITPGVGDAGAGVDSISFPFAPAIPDAGVGVEVATLAISIPLSDAATALDTLVVSVSAPLLTDAALAQEIPGNLVMIAIGDGAAGGDTIQQVKVTLPITDTGAGADTASMLSPVAVPDTGAGAEAPSIAAVQVAVADSASGAEVIAYGPLAVPVATSDSATATEAISLSLGVSITDTGAGLEVAAQPSTVVVALSDPAAATEFNVTVSKALPVADGGFGGELFGFGTVTINLPDAAAGTDVTALLVIPNTPVDGVAGAESITFASTMTLLILDSATGAELASFALNAVAVPADAAAGADAVAVANMFFITVPTDTAAGAEVVVLVPTQRAVFTVMSGPGKRRAIISGPGALTYNVPVSN